MCPGDTNGKLARFGKFYRLLLQSHASYCKPHMEKQPPTLRDLYPHLNEQQLAEVEDTFERYLALVWRIFERVEAQAGHLTANSDEIRLES